MERGSLSASRYDPGRPKAHHLSVLSSIGVTAWAVQGIERGDLLALHWSTGADVLNDPALPLHPVSVSFITLPEWSTMVPEGVLEPGTEAAHLALVHGGLPSGAMRDEPVRSLGAKCIYVHDDVTERAVLERLPSARALPMQGLMVRGAIARSHEGPVALVHRSTDRVDVAIADHGRVLLSNTFPARTGQDLLYFTLLALEQCGLSPKGTTVYMSGTHLSDGERNLLGRFLDRMLPAMDDLPNDLGAAEVVKGDRWLALLEQFACVS
jgi:hypothetical protein